MHVPSYGRLFQLLGSTISINARCVLTLVSTHLSLLTWSLATQGSSAVTAVCKRVERSTCLALGNIWVSRHSRQCLMGNWGPGYMTDPEKHCDISDERTI